MNSNEITIVCVKWGDGSPHFQGRGTEYANKLYAGVNRHIKRHTWEFVCMTDNPAGLRPEIRPLPLPNDLKGTWPKIGLFRRDLPGIHTTRLLYLDLANVIVGDLDELIDMKSDFAIARDWPPEMRDVSGYGSNSMLLTVGARPEVWESYHGNPDARRGDQDWITKSAPGADLFPYDWTPSYKLRNLAGLFAPPEGAKFATFHGIPKPHMCDGWVKEYWND